MLLLYYEVPITDPAAFMDILCDFQGVNGMADRHAGQLPQSVNSTAWRAYPPELRRLARAQLGYLRPYLEARTGRVPESWFRPLADAPEWV